MSKNVNDVSLRTNQNKAVEALLAGLNKGQAAAAAGVQPATLSRWLTESDFRTVLDDATYTAVKVAATRLTATVDQALTAVIDTLENKDVHPSTRLKAANMILTHFMTLRETAVLEERIERLEELINAKS